jgi:hypothetical protein
VDLIFHKRLGVAQKECQIKERFIIEWPFKNPLFKRSFALLSISIKMLAESLGGQ